MTSTLIVSLLQATLGLLMLAQQDPSISAEKKAAVLSVAQQAVTLAAQAAVALHQSPATPQIPSSSVSWEIAKKLIRDCKVTSIDIIASTVTLHMNDGTSVWATQGGPADSATQVVHELGGVCGTILITID